MNILDLFPDEEDGFLLPLSAEMMIINRIAELGFDAGNPVENRRKSLRVINLLDIGIKESECEKYRTKRQINHLDADILPNIADLLFEKQNDMLTKVALIDVNGDYINGFKEATRNDVDVIIAGVCDENTENGHKILEYIQLCSETGHFVYLIHAPGSKLKNTNFTNLN